MIYYYIHDSLDGWLHPCRGSISYDPSSQMVASMLRIDIHDFFLMDSCAYTMDSCIVICLSCLSDMTIRFQICTCMFCYRISDNRL